MAAATALRLLPPPLRGVPEESTPQSLLTASRVFAGHHGFGRSNDYLSRVLMDAWVTLPIATPLNAKWCAAKVERAYAD